jgi:RNA polymerase sigma-70 factor (ECF subfamily)
MADIGRVRSLFTAGAPADPAVDRAVDRAVDPVADALRRAGAGDHAAFAEVYRQLAPVVYGMVLKVVRDPAMSEEVTQEVFVELWRLAPRYDRERGTPRTWAATVAHRRAVDRVRSEQSLRNREEAESRRAERERDDFVEEVVDRLDRTRVAAALDQLTGPQREAVTLAYFGGHTYREVAALLGVPEGTIKTRIRDGLIKLRDLMGVAS